MYSCILSLSSALKVMGGQRHVSTVLTLGKSRYLFYNWLSGPSGRFG